MGEGYEALRRGAAWLDLSERGRIEARGRDRVRLLHNITSNDVKALKPGSGCYAFALNPQGRIQADMLLFCFEDRVLIDTEPELREKLPQHIRRYIIADQVELEDTTARTAAIGVEGPGAEGALAALGAPIPQADYGHLPWEDAIVARVSATGQPGFRIVCPADGAPALIDRLEAAGAKAASAEDARIVRIENGRPRYGEDIRDTSLPQETQQMHAVSFNKGCYLGQEIVERIRARGQVHRKLILLNLDRAELPQPGAVVQWEGKQVEITSAAWSPDAARIVALGYAREPAQ